MSLYGRQYPWSKWKKHTAVAKDPLLMEHIPDTDLLTPQSLEHFLTTYSDIYAKPCYGGGGRGVMKLSLHGDTVQIQTLSGRIEAPREEAYSHLLAEIGTKSYILQQGIDLVQWEGRSIDFRVLLLRPKGRWRYMGVMAKLAPKGLIVTNHCRGGQSVRLEKALKEALGLSDAEIDDIESRMKTLGCSIAKTLHDRFPLITELGLDIGIDRNLRLWLIEANTRPQYKLFKRHKNQRLYFKIDKLIKALRQSRSRESG